MASLIHEAPLMELKQTLTKEVAVPQAEDHSLAIASLEQQIGVLEQRRSELFSIEKQALQILYDRINELRRQHAKLTKRMEASAAALKLAQRRKAMARKYHRLSLEPLRWRDKQGYPLFAIFSLDGPACLIHPDYRRCLPVLEKPLADCFQDVRRVCDDTNVELSCSFTGVIPREVKRAIAESKNDFRQILVIAEARWQEHVIPKGDPLAVGFDGDDLYLIADFETTSAEELLIFTLPKEDQTA